MAYNFEEGEILLIDKPLYWTSFNVVSKIRNLIRNRLHIKKIKVGHAGTLDPLASGLLIVCTGKKTKEIEGIQCQTKEYLALIEFGRSTPSYDLETPFDKEYPTEHLSEQLIKEVLTKFTGEIWQKPPVYSAKLIDGKRAYDYAREGKEVDIKSVQINIHEIELVSWASPVLEIKILCSKGTYIRSLAHEIGLSAGSGAYLKALKRTASGNYKIKDAMNLQYFEENLLSLQP